MKKKIGIVLIVCCLLLSLIVPAFADPLTMSAVDLFTAGWATYAASHGLSMTVSDNGIDSTASAPMSRSTLRGLLSGLFSEFNAISQDYTNIDAWADAFQDAISYVPSQAGNNVAFTMGRALVGWYDDFANWLLKSKYGLTHTDSGFAHSSGSFDAPLALNTNILPVTSSDPSDVRANGLAIGSYKAPNTTNIYVASSSAAVVSVGWYNTSPRDWIYFKTTSPNVSVYVVLGAASGLNENIPLSSYNSEYGYYYSGFYWNQNTRLIFVPEYDSLADFLGSDAYSNKIQLRPQDKYNESPIPVPNTAAEGYESDVLTGDWAIPGAEADSLPGVVDALVELVQSNEVVLDEVADPGGGGDGNSGDPDDYQSVGLADVFPFCLPFDLYNFFACLGADPVTPHFEIPFRVGDLVDYTFVIDLQQFETVALILRRVELLAFCVGLILITRDKMIKG